MSYLEMSEEEIHDLVERGGLDDDMLFSLYEEALEKVKELEEMLRWYVEEDEIHEGDPDNQYWIDGKHKAMKLLGMEIEE